MLGVIADRLNGPVLFRSNLYTPDEEDQKFFARHAIRPLLENSQLWRKFGPKASAEAKRMVFAGEMPTRKSKVQQAIFSSTPFHYMSALKAFLGLLQDDLIANGLENRLVEGQLKIRQFFRFKQPDYLEFPENVVELLEKFPTGNKKVHALAGVVRLLQSVIEHAKSTEGKKLFMTRHLGQMELSEDSRRWTTETERKEKKKDLKEIL